MTRDSQLPEETYLFAGGMMTVLVAGAETDGGYALLLARVPPGNATPPHYHDVDAEHLVMLDGTITAETAGRTAVYQPGDVAVSPPGQVHRLLNNGAVDASYLLLCAPAGFDSFVRDVGRRVDDPAAALEPMGERDVQRLVASAPSFGVRLTDEAALTRPASMSPEMAPRERFEALGNAVEVLAAQGDDDDAIVLLRAAPRPTGIGIFQQSGSPRRRAGGIELFVPTKGGAVHVRIASSAPAGLLIVTTRRVTRLLRKECRAESLGTNDDPQEQLLAFVRGLHGATPRGPVPPSSASNPVADARQGLPTL